MAPSFFPPTLRPLKNGETTGLWTSQRGAKLEAFGPDPVIAYYIACEAEVKAVATVMFCKRTGESEQRTKERLGELYV